MAGATPVFVDIEPETFNLDPAAAGARAHAAHPRHRARAPLRAARPPMDAHRRARPARAASRVVEDAAQAIGATSTGRPMAAWGDAACLSFYPTKNLGACGDGGMVLTTRDDVAERVRLLRDHGRPRPVRRTWSSGTAAGSTSCRRRCCA